MLSGSLTRGRMPWLAACFALVVLVLAPAVAHAEEPEPRWYSNRNELNATHTPVTAWGKLSLQSQAVGKITCINVMAASVWNEGTVPRGEFEGWGSDQCEAPELEKVYDEIFEPYIGKKITVFATAELPTLNQEREAFACKETEKEELQRIQKKLDECPNSSERESRSLISATRREETGFPWKFKVMNGTRNGEPAVVAQIGIPPTGQTCYPKEQGEEGEVPAKWEAVPQGCMRLDVIIPQIPVELVFYGTLTPTLLNGVKNGLSPSRFHFTPESGDLVSAQGSAPETEAEGELKFLASGGEQLVTAK